MTEKYDYSINLSLPWTAIRENIISSLPRIAMSAQQE